MKMNNKKFLKKVKINKVFCNKKVFKLGWWKNTLRVLVLNKTLKKWFIKNIVKTLLIWSNMCLFNYLIFNVFVLYKKLKIKFPNYKCFTKWYNKKIKIFLTKLTKLKKLKLYLNKQSHIKKLYVRREKALFNKLLRDIKKLVFFDKNQSWTNLKIVKSYYKERPVWITPLWKIQMKLKRLPTVAYHFYVYRKLVSLIFFWINYYLNIYYQYYFKSLFVLWLSKFSLYTIQYKTFASFRLYYDLNYFSFNSNNIFTKVHKYPILKEKVKFLFNCQLRFDYSKSWAELKKDEKKYFKKRTRLIQKLNRLEWKQKKVMKQKNATTFKK